MEGGTDDGCGLFSGGGGQHAGTALVSSRPNPSPSSRLPSSSKQVLVGAPAPPRPVPLPVEPSRCERTRLAFPWGGEAHAALVEPTPPMRAPSPLFRARMWTCAASCDVAGCRRMRPWTTACPAPPAPLSHRCRAYYALHLSCAPHSRRPRTSGATSAPGRPVTWACQGVRERWICQPVAASGALPKTGSRPCWAPGWKCLPARACPRR
jgi:hypothetical protein